MRAHCRCRLSGTVLLVVSKTFFSSFLTSVVSSLEPKCSGSALSATDKVQGNLNRVKTQTQNTEMATFVKLCASVELAVSRCRLKP